MSDTRMLTGPSYGVTANVTDHHLLRRGARVQILLSNPGSGHERVYVRGLSKGGRYIKTWIRSDLLCNVRPEWRHHTDGGLDMDDADRLAKKISEWNKPIEVTIGDLSDSIHMSAFKPLTEAKP